MPTARPRSASSTKTRCRPATRTETFVALRTEVQNWRWAGVPFYLRTGKRLAERDAQIVVNFRPTPHNIFPGVNRPNKLVIKLQPEDGLELHLLAAKGAGQSEALAPVSLDLDFDKAFAENRVGAYERLLLDVIAGRLNLFVRSDEQEEAWRWVEPVLAAWRRDDTPPRPYTAGTWGPPRRARWWRATASPGRKRSSAPRPLGKRDLPPELGASAVAERIAPVRQDQAEPRPRVDLPRDLAVDAADPAAARIELRRRIGVAAMQHQRPAPGAASRRSTPSEFRRTSPPAGWPSGSPRCV